jgi:predicted aconitase
VKIPTTLNSISTDRRQWKALGVPEPYASAANALADAYLQLDCQPTFTCAPYLLLDHDNNAQGQDWVWGESNAVVYANSVLGARTNKIADYLDICCAITGKVPREGMHVSSIRQPTILLDATGLFDEELDDALFPILGHLCGTLSDGRVPLLTGLENCHVSMDHLKAFCAAFGTTGSSPLIHVAGITPEAVESATVQKWIDSCCQVVVKVTTEHLQKTYQLLDKDDDPKVDLIALGSPHLSLSECQKLVELVCRAGNNLSHKHPDVRVIACISRSIQEEAEAAGYIQPLQDFGIEFVNDTCWCMLLDPPVIPAASNATIMTNSGKYAHYGPGLVKRRFRFGSMADCMQTATTGVYPGRANWLGTKRSFHSVIER